VLLHHRSKMSDDSFPRSTQYHHQLSHDASWSVDLPTSLPACDHSSTSALTQPMERYLDETDRPLFTTSDIPGEAPTFSFPSISSSPPMTYQDYNGPLDSLCLRYRSPSNSGLSSAMISSSNVSDRGHIPLTPPNRSIAACHSDVAYDVASLYGMNGYTCYGDPEPDHSGVTLHDVQTYADTQSEKVPFENDYPAYGTFAHEGYQPMHAVEEDVRDVDNPMPTRTIPCGEHEVNRGDAHEAAPVVRRRRALSLRSATSPYLPWKLSKRLSAGKRSTSSRPIADNDDRAAQNDTSNRSFPCALATYGCPSTFGSKNEWKRHVNTQHMRLGYWRCDQCPSSNNTKPNDFNRKDLFNQHVRRMHPTTTTTTSTETKPPRRKSRSISEHGDGDQALADKATRCYRRLRTPPVDTGCMFCDAVFHGPQAWDERMEHVGKHMEAEKKRGDGLGTGLGDWRVDEAMEEWLSTERIIVRVKGRWVLAEGRVLS